MVLSISERWLCYPAAAPSRLSHRRMPIAIQMGDVVCLAVRAVLCRAAAAMLGHG